MDVLLLTDAKSSLPALEWLAVVVAYWCGGEDSSNGDLSLGYLCTIEPSVAQSLPKHALHQFFQVVLNDLPSNLATIARREKLSATVLSNQLHWLFKLWSDLDVDKDTLVYVQRAILCCPQSSATSGDAFVSLAASILAAVP